MPFAFALAINPMYMCGNKDSQQYLASQFLRTSTSKCSFCNWRSTDYNLKPLVEIPDPATAKEAAGKLPVEHSSGDFQLLL